MASSAPVAATTVGADQGANADLDAALNDLTNLVVLLQCQSVTFLGTEFSRNPQQRAYQEQSSSLFWERMVFWYCFVCWPGSFKIC